MIKRDEKTAYKVASILEHYVSQEVINNIKKLCLLTPDVDNN